jgi:hypothetical protein
MKLKTFFPSLCFSTLSFTSFAGDMAPQLPTNLLLIEGGASYAYNFYNSTFVSPSSISTATPNGLAINPAQAAPNNFFGGYFGASLYRSSNWLFNARYDMYETKTKWNNNGSISSEISFSSIRATVSVDKVFGDITHFLYGAGIGVTLDNFNAGRNVNRSGSVVLGAETITGASVVEPTVEGLIMCRFFDNFAAKFNVAYQIPIHDAVESGSLLLNLGINYAFSI